MTDRETVERWMHAYERAWDSNDPADVRALFAPEGAYRFHPWDDPIEGHDRITAAWLDGRDEEGDHAFSWELVALDRDTAVVQGRTEYAAGPVYDNLWVIRFAGDGTARAFTEWFMEQPRDA